MGEVCDGMRALGGKLNYLGMESSPAKSTAEMHCVTGRGAVPSVLLCTDRPFFPAFIGQVETGTEGKKKRKKVRQTRTLCLRLVWYRDEQGRKYKFITNNWEITDEEVALIYKNRWSIETGFKKLKQNFQLTYFYSDTENGIKTQVWCTLIAYLLLQVIQTKSESEKAFSTIAALLRMHLISIP
ncbi:transposase [Petrimonas mucosa]|uniref:Transposase IS4-like domain-containing protein n=1 Tax=Petrimonas mucosa TaxID=1642646 RepID=A0A1G4G557_9BACT|nr:transposase [Petrimonas mucosa]SCM56254.1 putative protein {ECO:0000313/EMBL:CEA15704,1} [Petrimonas mucosa]